MSTTRARLIECGTDLFYRHGFIAVGLDAILEQVGVTKTTFYNHFESKDDLILAVLQEHDRWWQKHLHDSIAQRAPDARGQLLAIFDVLEEVVNEPDYAGCIFINVTVEFRSPHDPAHQLAKQAKQAIRQMIVDLATEAGADDPEQLAQELCVLIEGSLVGQQIACPAQPVQVAKRVAQMVIDDHIPATEATAA